MCQKKFHNENVYPSSNKKLRFSCLGQNMPQGSIRAHFIRHQRFPCLGQNMPQGSLRADFLFQGTFHQTPKISMLRAHFRAVD